MKENNYSKFMYSKFQQILAALFENSNVPTSIKTTFKAVNQILEFHTEAIQDLEKHLIKKAAKSQVNGLLSQKASVAEMSSTMGSVMEMLDKKINTKDLNHLLQQSFIKVDLENQMRKCEQKANIQMQALIQRLKNIQQNSKKQDFLSKIQNLLQNETTQNRQQIARHKTDVQNQIRSLKQAFKKFEEQSQIQKKYSVTELQNFRNSVELEFDTFKRDHNCIRETRLQKIIQQQIASALQHTQELIKATFQQQKLRLQKSIKPTHQEKTEKKEKIQQRLKGTAIELINQIRASCEDNTTQIKKIAKSLKKKEQQAFNQAVSKIKQEFKQTFLNIQKQAKAFSNEIQQITNTMSLNHYISRQQFSKEMMQIQLILGSKTSIQEVKSAFKAFESDVHVNMDHLRAQIINSRSLDQYGISSNITEQKNATKYLNYEQFKKFQTDINIIHENLCYQNIVGKWSWNGNNLNERIVCWESEMINTLPDNYIWTKNTQSIKVKNQGVYNLHFGIFTKSDCFAILYVNDKQVRCLKEKKDSNGQVIAKLMTQYIYLNENSRITVYFEGQKQAEGFFGLKRF